MPFYVEFHTYVYDIPYILQLAPKRSLSSCDSKQLICIVTAKTGSKIECILWVSIGGCAQLVSLESWMLIPRSNSVVPSVVNLYHRNPVRSLPMKSDISVSDMEERGKMWNY